MIDRQFIASEFAPLQGALTDAWRQIGRIEGAMQIYRQLNHKLDDEEQQDAIDAANLAASAANAAAPADKPLSEDEDEDATGTANDELNAAIAERVQEVAAAAREAPDQGRAGPPSVRLQDDPDHAPVDHP